VINEAKAVGDISRSVAGEKRLLEAAVGSGGLRHHYANKVANGGDDVRLEGAQDMTITQITVGRIARNCELRFSIVEPAYRVLLPEGRQHEAVGGGGRRRLVRGWLVAPPPGPE
jgi:hypothetical protein